MPTRAVLFDLDGVLVSSHDAWLAVVNEVAARFGAPRISRERLLEAFGQGPAADALTLYPGVDVRSIRAAYDEAMPRQLAHIRLGPETHDVLESLGARGLARAVVTNTQTSLAGLILDVTGIRTRVDTWVGVGGTIREKPAPDLLVAALSRLGLEPSDALMVGDSRYDREAAEALDVRFVHFDLLTGSGLAAALASALEA